MKPSFAERLARAGFAPSPPPPRREEVPRSALLADLRRRIEKLENRPPAPVPRIPPMPIHTGERPRRLRLDALPGALLDDGLVVVRHRVAPDERVGKVAPADAMIAHPDVAAPFAGLPTPAPRELLHGLRLLDIETTGLAGGTGTLAFCIGIAWFEADGTLVVEQLLLASPAQEAELLERLAQRLRGATLLVTFNGRSFDAPLLRTRCILSRRAPGPLATAPHLDLLGVSRRLWKHRSSDCRLVTLERAVLGRTRVDDVPGAMAPAAYAEYLRTGDATAMAPIVEHNRLDVVGSAALLAAALRTFELPLHWAEDPAEILAVGEYRYALGDEAGALPLVERAAELATQETRRRALTQLARIHRRAGRYHLARAAWDCYRAAFPRENRGYEELAKLLEHRLRDPAEALAVATAAPHQGSEPLARRVERLQKRIN